MQMPGQKLSLDVNGVYKLQLHVKYNLLKVHTQFLNSVVKETLKE